MAVRVQAILFDFDGVLINSEPVYDRHWEIWAAMHGVSLEHILSIHHGLPVVNTIGTVAPHLDAVKEADRFVKTCMSDLEGAVSHEGVPDLLRTLPAERWAIATSSYRPIVRNQLDYLGLLHPNVLVTIEDVTNGKPAPEPYIKAAEGLGFAPEECLVIEDSPTGVTAAKAAGATVIAVKTTKPAAVLGHADVIVERMTDLQFKSGDDYIEVSWGF